MTEYKVFNQAKLITSIKPDSDIYYLYENPDGQFELTFGDGILGSALRTGNVISLEWISTEKEAANGAKQFTSPNSIDGNLNYQIITRQPARGGLEKESIQSIKRNAPLTFASQNRAVVPNDYEAVLKEQFSNIETMRVWGGEDNDPPVYGKVFLSIKPKDADVLSSDQKRLIIDHILRVKSVMTISPMIVDPEFLYIVPHVFFKYDSILTPMTANDLENQVIDTIIQYDHTYLRQFNKVFRHSHFLSYIDNTHRAILNSTVRLHLQKRFLPVLNIPNNYEINFSNNFSNACTNIITKSSLFTVKGLANCMFKDLFVDEITGKRLVSIVQLDNGHERVVVRNAGYLTHNQVILTQFMPNAMKEGTIGIEVIPSSNDIVSTNNNLLTLDCLCPRFSITGEVDSIAAGSDFSGKRYSTTRK
jgi:hypothetical protein